MGPYIINELILDSDIQTQAGDEQVVEGDVLKLVRNAVVIGTRNIVQRIPVTPGVIPTARSLRSVFFVERNLMASGVSVTMTGVTVSEGNGHIFFQFSNGSQQEYDDFDHILTTEGTRDTSSEQAERDMCLMAARKSNNGANLAVLVGQTYVKDFVGIQPTLLSVNPGGPA